MVLEHVAHGARLFVIPGAVLDPNALRGRDLHVVNIAAVPQRLENVVRQPKDQDVLHRLFTKVMIDAVSLSLGKHVSDLRVEGLRSREVPAKRLLDDDPPPGRPRVARFIQSHGAELLYDVRIDTRRRGQVEDVVAATIVLARNRTEQHCQLLEVFTVAVVTRYVVQAFGELLPRFRIPRRRARKFPHGGLHLSAEDLGIPLAARESPRSRSRRGAARAAAS